MTTYIPAAKPTIGHEERAAVDRVLVSGMVAQGPEVAAFETEFSKVVDGIECVAVNSGTSALHMSLLAAGIGRGDEVIVPSFTFAATANAVRLAGAEPVFADIEADSFCLDPIAADAAVTSRTKAIMPVHLYGHPAAMDRFADLARKRGLLLLEDAAQAHAASFQGRPVGSWGIAGAFSFYPTKNMTSGEGGMVSTPDPGVARRVRLLRNQGMEQRYRNEIVGFNTRMTDIHAAIGRVQLRALPDWTEQRQRNADFLTANLEGVVTPVVASGAVHVFHQYTVRVPREDRDQFAVALHDRGVGSGVYYPVPTHRLPSFGLAVELPETERAAAECLSLPVYPGLSADELARVVEAVNTVAQAGA
jgi:dTDP-4-amino-4,6-dideoxygalactose transaminase